VAARWFFFLLDIGIDRGGGVELAALARSSYSRPHE
jgi:hypothetical protein